MIFEGPEEMRPFLEKSLMTKSTYLEQKASFFQTGRKL